MRFKIVNSTLPPQEPLTEVSLKMDAAGDIHLVVAGVTVGWLNVKERAFELTAVGSAHRAGLCQDEDGWLKIIR